MISSMKYLRSVIAGLLMVSFLAGALHDFMINDTHVELEHAHLHMQDSEMSIDLMIHTLFHHDLHFLTPVLAQASHATYEHPEESIITPTLGIPKALYEPPRFS